jgi:spermidine synthase
MVCGLSLAGLLSSAHILAAHRDFFGVLRVTQTDDTRNLVHGTTIHGAQITDPLDHTPTSYYYPAAPMGAAVARLPAGARIAVVGLGTGSLAALTKAGQSIDYYELDPQVEPLARRWFTYLGDARGTVEIHLGDARLTLAEAAPGIYDLAVIDAFSSDAVPVHLLTVEAVGMYLDKLKPDGLVLLHISNRHLDLARVARGVARRLGAHAALQFYVPDDDLAEKKAVAKSMVVALSRSRAAIDRLTSDENDDWDPLGDGPEQTWTDDRSSLFGVLRW